MSVNTLDEGIVMNYDNGPLICLHLGINNVFYAQWGPIKKSVASLQVIVYIIDKDQAQNLLYELNFKNYNCPEGNRKYRCA